MSDHPEKSDFFRRLSIWIYVALIPYWRMPEYDLMACFIFHASFSFLYINFDIITIYVSWADTACIYKTLGEHWLNP